MRIAKAFAFDEECLNEEVKSYQRDFRVKDIIYAERNNIKYAFIEYNYKGYPDNVQIDNVDMSVRLYNCLRRSDIDTLGQLKHFFLTGELKRIRNLGALCIKEAAKILTENYKADYNQFIESIIDNNYINAIDYTRYVKVGVPFYW